MIPTTQGRPRDLFLILLLTVVLFLPTLSQSFVSWDDEGHLTENRFVKNFTLENIQGIFHSDVNRTYIPLTVLSFSVEHHFFGYNPFVYHLDNLLLHLAVVVAIYFLAMSLGLGPWACAMAALVFAVHPMHVESVAWVTQRKDVLYGFFYILALGQYAVYVQDQRSVSYILAVIFAFLSILSKPMALSLPLVICLLDWYLRRPVSWKIVLEKMPFFIAVVPVAWLTYAMNMRAADLQFPQSVLIWIWCLVFYLFKFFVPLDFLVLYQLPQPVAVGNLEYALAIALLIGLIWVLIKFKQDRLFIFAAAFFFLSVFFLLRFDNKQDLTIVADRFMYVPSLGACLWLGMLAEKFIQRSSERKREVGRFAVGIIAAVVLVLAVLTHIRVRQWGDEELLWRQVAARYNSGLAYAQLGNYFLKKKDFPQARENYDKAIGRLPSYSKPYSNRGIINLKQFRYAEAIADFSKAIELDRSASAVLFNNRGYAYMLTGDYDRASQDYDRGIAADPQYIAVYLNRATLHKDKQDLRSALDDLQKVLSLDPGNEIARNNKRILEGMMTHGQ